MEYRLSDAEMFRIDQRTISLRRIGSGNRKILFFHGFHGFPGSSAQIEPFRFYLDRFDLEVVCIDRPGYHKSERVEESQMRQATTASKNIVDALKWSSCEVISVSGGTPFLFSFVQAYPQFISGVSIVSGLGPIASDGFQCFLNWKTKLALKTLPRIPGRLFEKILPNSNGYVNSNPRFNIVRFFLPASEADLKAMQNPLIQNALGQALREAFAQNGLGPQQDAKEYLTSWDLNLTEYQGPIHIWHGDDDRILPVTMAQHMAKSIKGAQLHIAPGEGHYSLAVSKIADVLKMGLQNHD